MNQSVVLSHLGGGGILELSCQRDVEIINNFVFYAWNMEHCEFQSLLLAISLSDQFPDTLKRGLWPTTMMRLSYSRTKNVALSRASTAVASPSMGAY